MFTNYALYFILLLTKIKGISCSRFAGPATTVEVFCPAAVSKASKEVRTEGEAVSETGERFMEFVLYQDQITILSSGEELVYLSGDVLHWQQNI